MDASGNAYVTGSTVEGDFPVSENGFQKTNKVVPSYSSSQASAFVTKLNPAGSALVYSSYLGGSTDQQSNAIAIDPNGDACVTGYTISADFPVTTSAFQRTLPSSNNCGYGPAGCSNAFVTEFAPAGSALVYSTFLGGNNFYIVNGQGDVGTGIAIDQKGEASITGAAYSTNFPVTRDALQTANLVTISYRVGSSNAFFARLKSDGSSLLYSTYLGGSNIDTGAGIAVEKACNAYLVSNTGSNDFPITSEIFQKRPSTVAVSKFAFAPGLPTSLSLVSDENPQKGDGTVTFVAHVQPLSGKGVPTGTVSSGAQGGPLVKVQLDGSGNATYTTDVLPPGIYSIVASYSGDSNYAPTSADLIQTLYGAPATVRYDGGFFGYGDITYGTTASGSVLVQDANLVPVPGVEVKFGGQGLKFSLPSPLTNASGVVTTNVTAALVGARSLKVTAGSVQAVIDQFTVTQAPLTVTANNLTVAQGQPIPKLSYTLSGFVIGDTAAVVSGAPVLTTTATQGSPAGSYPITITVGTLTSKNYSFTPISGTLTITAP